ncbi:MAG: hypothetical protein B6I20_07745 [Bacteroidetes bacterium 4572_117]|nr:MAG: hypothetical protein B6I20_07745 [Bacteroidetes bacterium 4572_117]
MFIILGLLFFSSSCFSTPTAEEKEKGKKLADLMESYAKPEKNNSELSDIQDMAELIYEAKLQNSNNSTINITEDSIDIALYNLIANSYKTPAKELIKNIENLISKGANPNAVVTIKASVRKAGTYIPIIKHFYKNRYRKYTYTSTAFHAAVAKGDINIVQKLIDLGAKTNIPAKKGDYPIDIAIMADNNKMIFFLIDNGSDVKGIDLSKSKNTDLIEKLVKLGADPNTIDINYTLNNKTELNRLLDLNPDLSNIRLDFEELFNDDELLDLLLKNGLPFNTKGTFTDNCPLIFGAVKYGNIKALEKLISLGADKSGRCRSGFSETPLLMAIHVKNAEIVDYLLKKGVNPNETEWTDKSALFNAAETDNDVIINLLVDAGAKLEYSKYFGKTPLMQAVSRKKYIAVKTLLNRGANVNFKNKYDETPLVLAIKENDYPIIELLVKNGAKTDIKYKGKTLAEFAGSEKASPMIIDYLADH